MALLGCENSRGFGDDTGPPCTSYGVTIESFSPGLGAGLGADDARGQISAGPFGGGDERPSADVLSLGIGGELIVDCQWGVLNGPGPDFVIFENAFLTGETPDSVFAEPAQVSVSGSVAVWHDFPCDPTAYPYVGCAGVRPVYANVETNDISPLDFTLAGGDVFDLAVAGVPTDEYIFFIRIRDVGGRWGEAGTSGFDLDAIWAK